MLQGGLIVSCQAPAGSPLNDPYIISALALTAEQHGAVGVRIKHAEQVAATRARVHVPVIGLDKVECAASPVYITPTFASAERLAASGADIIATDATLRPRPNGETLDVLIRRIQDELHKPVLADVATLDEGLHAADCGAAFVATTLCGYTEETAGMNLPAFDLLEKLAARLTLPVICEGGVSTPKDVRRAFDCGAFAVVVGTAITGVGQLVGRIVTATPRATPR
ncbi:MAG: N-acetylmannosamine-6-phosphate 2-epimerase [Acidobacteria bacterium]|nr:N-acetylmannosamine-6-phosphate 2-epimerase [Acidobacteriota bacterium]